MKLNRYIYIFILLSLGLIISCSKSTTVGDEPQPIPSQPNNSINITNLNIQSSYSVSKNYVLTFEGNGFLHGDKIQLKNASTPNLFYDIVIQNVQANRVDIVIPSDFQEGNYNLILLRGNQNKSLGSSKFFMVFNANIPDKSNMTIKGTVYANGKGLSNVVVSDGFEVTKTDANGVYYLPSAKKNGYVFVSIPSNYEVKNLGNVPQFFKYTTERNSTVEIKDFELTAVQNDNHSMIFMTDFHLANRTNDLLQYENGFVKDVNSTITQLKGQGKKVYGLTLGDLSWDTYWYANNFALPEFIPQINKVQATTFHVIGNHDNDPYLAGDWNSEATYKKVMGPTYYSFNIGQVHYVVLDNVEYTNAGGSYGVIGDRKYNAKIVADQINWLKKDLEQISDKSTPIIIAMHIQLNNAPTVNQTASMRISNGQELISALSAFDNVHVLTGHTHVNYKFENSNRLMEHNTGAVCATWWWTGKNGYTGNHIGKDGSPGGYAVWDMGSKDLKWYFKGIGKDKNYQFRAYDLNEVHITAAKFAPNTTDQKLKEFTHGYENKNNKNEILVNVWGYDPKWKIEIRENGNPLTVSRVSAYDPLHIVSYAAMRLNDNSTPTEDFLTGSSTHFFKATATSSTSTIHIKVTDRFNTIYEETMIRPKAFTINMQ